MAPTLAPLPPPQSLPLSFPVAPSGRRGARTALPTFPPPRSRPVSFRGMEGPQGSVSYKAGFNSSTVAPLLLPPARQPRRGRSAAWGMLVVAALAAGAGGRLTMNESRPALPATVLDGQPEDARSEIVSILTSHYFRGVDTDLIARRQIVDLPSVLDDPYTHFMDQAQYQKFMDEESGRYVGIGIHVSTMGDEFRIDRVFPGSPAAQAGLRAGDTLTSVDGYPTNGVTLAETLARIRGPEGGSVQLQVNSHGTVHSIIVTRAKVRGWLVQSEIRTAGDRRVGYLTLLDFSEGVGDRTREAVQSLINDGADAIVIDLRGNPGGLAKESVRTAEVFLPAGSAVLTERGEHIDTKTFSTHFPPVDTNIPLAVLVDGQTASSAEILAGALRDNGRAELFGSTTFGKGRIQDIITLQTGGAFKYTYAEYLTPSGFALDRVGLTPDFDVASPGTRVDAAYDESVEVLLAKPQSLPKKENP
jgi:carboxyl-terminal processing protease